MLQYTNANIREFDGGLTDRVVDSSAKTFDELFNFRVDKHKNLKLREGFDLYKDGAAVNTVSHYMKRGQFGRLRCVSGQNVVYEDDNGDIVLGGGGSSLDANIDAYSTISGFRWRGFDFMTISANASGRFNLYTMFRSDVNDAAISHSAVASPKFIYDDANIRDGSAGTTRYLLVYMLSQTANGNSGDASTIASYGVAYKSDTISYEGGTAILHDIPRSDTYSDIETSAAHPKHHVIKIYRAASADLNTFYLAKTFEVADQSALTFDYDDNMTDEVLVTQERYYESDGITNMGRPPKHTCSCLIGNTAYYGNVAVYDNDSGYNAQYIEQPYGVIQSMDGNPSMVKDSFLLEVEEIVTGLSNIGSSLIVFTASKIYKFEGKYNNDGSGSYSRRIISDEAGCISHASIVSAGSIVYFCGADGVYMTDGYQVSKISVTAKYDISKTYEALIADYVVSGSPIPSDIRRTKITGHYDSSKDSVYWTVCKGSSSPNMLLCYDTFNSLFYTLGGNGVEFSSLLIDDGILAGSLHSDIMQFHDKYRQDIVSKNPLNYSYIPYQAKTSALDFGDPSVKKWVQALTTTITASSKIAVKTNSYNDNGSAPKAMKSIVVDSILLWRDVNMLWRDDKMLWRVPPTRSFRRHFPKRGLRCRYKQVEFVPAVAEQYSSSAHGTATVTYLVEGDPAKFRVKLDDSNIQWPTDCLGYSIAFADDSYEIKHAIRSFDGANLDLAIDGGGLTPSATKQWRIYGIRKQQEFVIENITYQYAPIDNTGVNYRGSSE